MPTSTKRRLRLVGIVAAYLTIAVVALWLAESDATTTPSFIYQAF